MDNKSDFILLTLNADSMYSQEALSPAFNRVLQSFYTHLSTSPNQNIANLLRNLVTPARLANVPNILQQLKNLAIGENFLLRDGGGESAVLIYKFKKESTETLSFSLCSLGIKLTERNAALTILDSNERLEDITHTFNLNSDKADIELTNLITDAIKLVYQGRRYGPDELTGLQRNLGFLHPTIRIQIDQTPVALLQRQSYFVHALYRLLGDCVADRIALEQCLLRFVGATILQSPIIAQRYPELYKQAITNHIAYFHLTKCENETTKKNETHLLQTALQQINLSRSFKIDIKREDQPTVTSLAYHALQSTPPARNRSQLGSRTKNVPDVPFLSRDSVTSPLHDATQFHQLLDVHARYHNGWAMMSIEYFILRCPLPMQANGNPHPSYQTLQPSDWKAFGNALERIGQHYTMAMETHLQGKQTPKAWVTLCTMVFLRSHCHQQENKGYSIQPLVQDILHRLISKIAVLPHLSTYHPDFDQRWQTLVTLCVPNNSRNFSETYRDLLQTSSDYSAIQSAVTRANTLSLKKQNQTPMEYYFAYAAQFPDAAQKFNDALQLELFLSNCLAALMLSRHIPQEFSWQYNSISTPLYGLSYSIDNSTLNNEKFITTSKERCNKGSLTAIALRSKYVYLLTARSYPPETYSSNTVQVKPQYGDKDRPMTPDDITLRQMLQFGFKDNPIPLVLDHYFSAIHDLATPDTQDFVLENVLLGRALSPYIRQTAQFAPYLTLFDAFIEKGLKHFETNAHRLSQTSLFFIQLALLNNTYLALDARYDQGNRLLTLLQSLNHWIASHRENHAISASLHQYRLSLILTLKELAPHDNTHFDDAFLSYGYLKIHRNLEKTETLVEKTEQEKSHYQFQCWLQQAFEQHVTPDLIHRLAVQIELPLEAEDQISIAHRDRIEILRDSDVIFVFRLDLAIFLNAEGLRYTSIPEAIRKHPILAYLNQTAQYCFCDVTHSIVELAHDSHETRLEFLGQQVNVYQSHVVFGQKAQYQLIPLNTLGRTGITFQMSVLPLSFNHSWDKYKFSDHLRCWLSLTRPCAYIMHHDKVMYTVTTDKIVFHDPNNAATEFLHYGGNQNQIKPLENPNYCHMHLNPTTKVGHMHLVRYPGISFEIAETTLSFVHHDQRYIQILKGETLFTAAANVSHLQFQHTDNPTQRIALLTVRAFSRSYTTNDYIGKSNQSDVDSDLKTVIYDVDPSTLLLRTHNASDALFLAYVYTATYDHDKAIATLNTLNLVELQTSRDEVTFLEWMIGITDGNEKHLAACQLKAFSLYARCIQEKQSGKIDHKDRLLPLLPTIANAYRVYLEHIHTLPRMYLLDDLAIDGLERFFAQQSKTPLREKKLISRQASVEETEVRTYFDLPDTFNNDLFHRPNGNVSLRTAANQLTSAFKESDFPTYFAAFVQMTQSEDYKAQILSFCKAYLQYDPYSSFAKALYHLCHQTLPSNSKKADDITINRQTQTFSYHAITTSTTTLLLDKPNTSIVPTTALLSLQPNLEPITAMTQFMQTHYSEFHERFQSLDAEYYDALGQANTDAEFGNIKLTYFSRKLDLMRDTFGDSEARNILVSQLERSRSDLNHKQQLSWALALECANKPLQNQYYYLIEAGLFSLVTEEELMRCYATRSFDTYAAITTLTDPSAIQHLHQNIHIAMIATLQHQQFQRLITELTSVQNQPAEIVRWGKLLDLMLREHVPELNNRTDMIHLEVTKNIMIRPEQKRMADSLQESPCIIDGTMGVGKTSVVIPETVSQIPDRTLFVVIVLRALLKTTHGYLHTVGATTKQISYLFDFHRNGENSIQAYSAKRALFEELTFHNNPLRPHYLVSTADSIQSLGLKFLELTYIKQFKEFEQQIQCLEHMLLLLLNNGYYLIDEVHEVQDDAKSAIRYALDKPVPISQELVQDVVGLYKFRQNHPFVNRPDCVTSLFESADSPLHKHLKQCIKNNPSLTPDNIKESIVAYLLKNRPLHCDLSPRFRRYLKTIQTQLHLFEYIKPEFFKRVFGPSKLRNISALERILARPYRKSEKVKEDSHFENPQEYIAYTIETAIRELPYDLCLALIQKWLDQAGIELQNSSDQFPTFQDTPAAIRFRDHFALMLDPEILQNETTVIQIWKCIQNDQEILFDILEYDILPQIEVDCTVIESRAFDHVFSYRAGSGLTATPDKAYQNLPIDNSASRGEREFIEALLIQHKTPVRHVDFINLEVFMNDLYINHPNPSKFSAIFDIGGRIKGENKDIARAFAHVLAQHDSPVQYVIYYDDSDELYAVSTRNLDQIIALGLSTNPQTLSSKLKGCPIQEMGLFLDESHTEGADHVLAVDCNAACILGTETPYDKMMQGFLRERDIKERQRLTVYLPFALSAITTIDMVISYTKELANTALPLRTLSSASGEILGLVRRDLLNRMIALPTIEAKHEFIHQPDVEAFFVRSRADEVEEYEVTDMHSANSLLTAHATKTVKKWHEAVPEDHVDPSIEEKIQSIQQRSMPAIKPASLEMYGGTLETQTQIQIQVVPRDLGVKFNPDLTANKINKWSPATVMSLSQLLPSPTQLGFMFSPNIVVSSNFRAVHKDQANIAIHPYMKPVDLVLFTLDAPDQITACLITNEEADDPDLAQQIQKSSGKMWISTTNHLVTAGQAPAGIQDALSYQNLLEQIRFFAGKLSELVEQKTSYSWLPDEPKRKFDFYESTLRQWRKLDPNNFEKLKASFSRHLIVFREMSKYPFKHYAEDFAWEEIDPDITPADIHIFYALGQAYQQMNRHYYEYDFIEGKHFQLAQSLKKTLRLPPVVLGYVTQHLTKLSELKAALKALVEPQDEHYLMRFVTLDEDQKRRIEEILSLSISQLLTQYGYHADLAVFPNSTAQLQFELDVLGSFLASPAFPEGASPAFSQPIQGSLASLETAVQRDLFVSLPVTEYKLRYLLNVLDLKTETLVALAQQVQEEATALALMSHCHNSHDILSICLQKFSSSEAILNEATKYAVSEATFGILLQIAEQQARLFTEEWLTLLFQNRDTPVQSLITLLERPDVNDVYLRHTLEDPRIIDTLISTPLVLISVLNRLAANLIVDSSLKQQVIAAWVNRYATQPSTGELTRQTHGFYQALLAAILTAEGDAALGYVITDTAIHSHDLLPNIVTSVIEHVEEERCIFRSKVYKALLAHYLKIDSRPLVKLLLEQSKKDSHLQQLMDSQHVAFFAGTFVSRAQKLDWLIDHPKTNPTVLLRIIQDQRFTSAFALRMLRRDLPPEVILELQASRVCDADVHIAILQDQSKSAYHDASVRTLLTKLPFADAGHLLTLIQHPACSHPNQIERLIPHCGNLDQKQAIIHKGLSQPDAILFNRLQRLLTEYDFEKEQLTQLLANHPLTQPSSTDEHILCLQNAAQQLYDKTQRYLNAGKASHQDATKAAAALYFCMYHQLNQYERSIITKETLGHNLDGVLKQYKDALSAHHGYRQLCYDIAQVLLCLIGVGIAMTAYAYATTGSLRFFVWKNEAQRIVEEAQCATEAVITASAG